MSEHIKPFIKWQGGKSRTKDIIISHFKKFNIYIEPFLGSGAILFKLKPKKAIISDINTNLINTYMIIKKYKDIVMEKLDLHIKKYIPMNNERRKIYFLKIRERYNNIKLYKSSIIEEKNIKIRIECAVLFIFINKTCFNGLYRENMKEKYNVSMGRYKHPKIYNKDIINSVSNYLNNNDISILYGDYSNILIYIRKHKINIKNAIIYLDPPFYPLKKTSFTWYCGKKFEHIDHIKVFEFCKNINFTFYLSNSLCEVIKKLYKEYKIINIKVKRCGGGIKNKKNINTIECLIIGF